MTGLRIRRSWNQAQISVRGKRVPRSHTLGTRSSFFRLKPPQREVDNSPPASAEVKNVCNYTSTRLTLPLA
jgi:hypothetical protein